MKGGLSDSWRLWVLFGMGNSLLYTKIWHQSRYQARIRGWHWSLSSSITVASSSCWEDKRKRLLGVKRVSKIMRHIPCAYGVPVAQRIEAHTVYSQQWGPMSRTWIKSSPRLWSGYFCLESRTSFNPCIAQKVLNFSFMLLSFIKPQ